jgi:hypothetical protein
MQIVRTLRAALTDLTKRQQAEAAATTLEIESKGSDEDRAALAGSGSSRTIVEQT